MNKRQPNFTSDEMEVIGCWCGGKQQSECRAKRSGRRGGLAKRTTHTSDPSALVWWVGSDRTDWHWCRSFLETVRTQLLNCLAPGAELSRPKCRSVLARFWQLQYVA